MIRKNKKNKIIRTVCTIKSGQPEPVKLNSSKNNRYKSDNNENIKFTTEQQQKYKNKYRNRSL